MKATETRFLPFLQGTKQFIIPIYQRTYSWTQTQCQQLWDDIRRAGSDEKISGHFVGSIVYIDQGLFQVTAVPQLLVIDGQQRLTTLSLLIAALGKVIEEKNIDIEISRKKIGNYYLFNAEEEGELHYKLVLTQSDRDTLIRILEERELPSQCSGLIRQSYEFYLDRLRKQPRELTNIYNGIGKLIIVDIALDRERDNPQLIFESLNSTGLCLSQADLIRNYVLMGLERGLQTELYNKYWYPMEQSFGHAEYAAHFDRFMRDYLTIKTGRIPNINDVYSVFKSHSQTAGLTTEKIVAEIYRYSKYFVRLAFLKDGDADINAALDDINTLRVDVAYPFLMEVFDDYERAVIDRDTALAVVRLIESYVFRRVICGIPTNSLNKTFANLYKEIDKKDYLDSLKEAFLLRDSYRRFPNDEEFRRELIVKDIYSLRNRNYLLRKLENFERKEIVNIESCTIEHIMPQNPTLSEEWQRDLGDHWKDVQAKYLHTLGNLTLTGYNPELSDRPFQTKRDMSGGFRDSPLRLNRGLAQLEKWDESQIVLRADRLASVAERVWPQPVLPPEKAAELEYKKVIQFIPYTLDLHAENLKGPILTLFEELRKRILNLDSSVREEILKLYIAYKTDTNFVDIIPQKSGLRLSLNMRFDEIDDPKGICRDITGLGKWGNGDVEVRVSSRDDIDNVMPLVHQSFEKHFDGNTTARD